MAWPKRVIRVKLFRRWFIFCDCIKFRLFLFKLPPTAPAAAAALLARYKMFY
jgi:hypothetical protein